MAARKKTTKKPAVKKGEKAILAQFLDELNRAAGGGGRITKGQALVRSMVNEALKGDPKMLANVLKLIDKLGNLEEDPAAETEARHPAEDWISLFAFYAKYRTPIEQEIERLKGHDPSYWSFDWFKPSLKSAPWHDALHGGKTARRR